jgi:hypothetical protein
MLLLFLILPISAAVIGISETEKPFLRAPTTRQVRSGRRNDPQSAPHPACFHTAVNSLTMLLALELVVIVAVFVYGCWSRSAAIVFLPIVGLSVTLFAALLGNPIGLLTSGGGWMILDVFLLVVALIARMTSGVLRR